MNIDSAEDLFAHELRGIHSAEKQLSRILPRLSKQVTAESAREKLQERLEHGRVLLESIDRAFEELEVSKGRFKNSAVEGLIEDAQEMIDTIDDERVLDCALIGAVQKVEHYCIASWGTAAALGRMLGQQTAVSALEKALEQGKQFDQAMTELAEKEVNPTLLEGDEEEEAGEEASKSSRSSSGAKKKGSKGQQARSGRNGGDGADLKSREYRDSEGNVHHHTKRYMEQHGKSGSRE